MKGSTKSRARVSAFEPQCQILTCRKLGCLPVSPPFLLSHLSPLFSHILLYPLFILNLGLEKAFSSLCFTTVRGILLE